VHASGVCICCKRLLYIVTNRIRVLSVENSLCLRPKLSQHSSLPRFTIFLPGEDITHFENFNKSFSSFYNHPFISLQIYFVGLTKHLCRGEHNTATCRLFQFDQELAAPLEFHIVRIPGDPRTYSILCVIIY
jgi:hypothetical protein